MSDFRDTLFTYHSYMPIPFLLAMVVWAQPTLESMLAGAAVAACGELLRFWGVAYAGSLTRVTGSVGAPELIVAGPFAYVRNPLYVGNILLYVGVGIMSQALWPWLPLVALLWFIFQYSMIVSREEEFLRKEFGDAYAEYVANVPRFFPRLQPWEHPSQEHQSVHWDAGVASERRTFQAIGVVMILLVIIWSVR